MTFEGQAPRCSQPGRVDIAAMALRWNSMTLERAAVGARGKLNALDVTIHSEGQWQEPFALAATASVPQQNDSVGTGKRCGCKRSVSYCTLRATQLHSKYRHHVFVQ